VAVLDIDNKHDGQNTLGELEKKHGYLPKGLEVITGAGHHFYFKYPVGIDIPSKAGIAAGIDIRAQGAYAIAPPSLHISGRRYVWAIELGGTTPGDLPELPSWVIDLATQRKKRSHSARKCNVPEGERNQHLTSLAGSMRRRGMSQEAIFAALNVENQNCCRPPLRDREVEAIAHSVGRYDPSSKPAPQPRDDDEEIPLTDVGNSMRLAKLLKDSFRYIDRAMYRYDGRRWREDNELEHIRIAKGVGAGILGEAARIHNDDRRLRTARWGATSQNDARIAAMVRLVRPDIVESYERFDTDPFLLNCKNGTLNLRTGVLRKHAAEDYITKFSPVEYDADAKCLKFEEFLSRIFGADYDLIDFIQRAVGYSLTGTTEEQCLFILHGGGANGKSTLISALEYILGGYATTTRPETFSAQRNDTIPCDLADLAGARFVSAIETDESRRLNEGLVKAVTGGDLVKARFLHRNFFTYRPAYKLWFATNHCPRIRGTDLGIWRRIKLIPFAVSILGAEQDKTLIERLKGEAAGILAWAVRGCAAWQQSGLGSAGAVDSATSMYKQDMDAVRAWADERCVVDLMANQRTSNEALLRSFNDWARSNHERELSSRELGHRLPELGLNPFKSNVTRGWCGITVKTSDSLFGDEEEGQ
jgi:putative DNA primase/helicase